MTKHELFQLIENWDNFTQESTENSLENFALWLLQKKENKADRSQKTRDICYLLSRIERYHKVQVKKLFQDLPLLGYEDFILLNTVYHNPNIAKKELYDLSIYDMNSGTPTINRLKREGLLIDIQSEIDKRVYLLNITEKGKIVRNTAFERFTATLPNKFSILSDQTLDSFYQTAYEVEKHFELLFGNNKRI